MSTTCAAQLTIRLPARSYSMPAALPSLTASLPLPRNNVSLGPRVRPNGPTAPNAQSCPPALTHRADARPPPPAPQQGIFASSARSLASRMFHAASNALWRRDEAAEARQEAERAALASFFVERAKYIPMRLEIRERKVVIGC